MGELGRVLEDEGIMDDTLFVVTSDHREHLGQHYEFYGDAMGVHDAVTCLPLIMRYPKMLSRK